MRLLADFRVKNFGYKDTQNIWTRTLVFDIFIPLFVGTYSVSAPRNLRTPDILRESKPAHYCLYDFLPVKKQDFPVLIVVNGRGSSDGKRKMVSTDKMFTWALCLEIDVGSHAARNAKSGSNSRGYRHNELDNQLPSVLFRFSTHSEK